MRYRNDITRTWHLTPRRTVVHVTTLHRQYGTLVRGRIERTRGGGWSITDYDHNHHGIHHGDYLDAEQVLLDATTELDQITPANPDKEARP